MVRAGVVVAAGSPDTAASVELSSETGCTAPPIEIGIISTVFEVAATLVCHEMVACEKEYPQQFLPEGAYPCPPGAANQAVGPAEAFIEMFERTGPGACTAGVVNV